MLICYVIVVHQTTSIPDTQHHCAEFVLVPVTKSCRAHIYQKRIIISLAQNLFLFSHHDHTSISRKNETWVFGSGFGRSSRVLGRGGKTSTSSSSLEITTSLFLLSVKIFPIVRWIPSKTTQKMLVAIVQSSLTWATESFLCAVGEHTHGTIPTRLLDGMVGSMHEHGQISAFESTQIIHWIQIILCCSRLMLFPSLLCIFTTTLHHSLLLLLSFFFVLFFVVILILTVFFTPIVLVCCKSGFCYHCILFWLILWQPLNISMSFHCKNLAITCFCLSNKKLQTLLFHWGEIQKRAFNDGWNNLDLISHWKSGNIPFPCQFLPQSQKETNFVSFFVEEKFFLCDKCHFCHCQCNVHDWSSQLTTAVFCHNELEHSLSHFLSHFLKCRSTTSKTREHTSVWTMKHCHCSHVFSKMNLVCVAEHLTQWVIFDVHDCWCPWKRLSGVNFSHRVALSWTIVLCSLCTKLFLHWMNDSMQMHSQQIWFFNPWALFPQFAFFHLQSMGNKLQWAFSWHQTTEKRALASLGDCNHCCHFTWTRHAPADAKQ